MSEKQKTLAIGFTILAVTLAVMIAVGGVVLQQYDKVMNQFKFSVYPKPQLTNETLYFTLHFVLLPEEGAKFDYIIVDDFKAEAWANKLFYTGDNVNFMFYHDGTIKTIPTEVLLFYGDIIFRISLVDKV